MSSAMMALVAVISICGVLGGYAGHLLSPPTTDEREARGAPREWWVWRAIFLGIVASLLVPLFLKLFGAVLGSQDSLTEQILTGEGKKLESWFVFGGFCLIAAASSQRFVSNLTDAILKDMQQEIKVAKKVARDAEDEVEALGEDQQMLAQPHIAAAAAQINLTDQEKTLLRWMAASPIRRPAPHDIALATGLPVDEVRQLLTSLQNKSYVQRRADAPNGAERWRIRTQGKVLAQQL